MLRTVVEAMRRPLVGWSATGLVWVLAVLAVVTAFGRVERVPTAAVSAQTRGSTGAPTATPTGTPTGATRPPATPVEHPKGPGYLTVVIGRSEWAASAGCVPLAGAVTLDRVAQVLAERGLVASGGVVPLAVAETDRTCDDGFAVRTSWSDLASLRDEHGWTFFPRSSGPLDGLDEEQQRAETCGARDALQARGHERSWGLFAYANNARDSVVQARIVSSCFAFGRSYGSGVNRRGAAAQPWWLSTKSVNGGRCAAADLPCVATSLAPTPYDPPESLVGVVRPDDGSWNVIQFYRFVEGSGGVPGGAGATSRPSWDCTSPDPAAHWTNRPELYCFADFVAVLDAIGGGTVVTDPATVADAWGRRPPE